MRQRALIVCHGPDALKVEVHDDSHFENLGIIRTELIPPHTQQEILFRKGQYLVVKGE